MLRALLTWLYDRLYHELAWAYDPVSWLVSGGRWRQWRRSALGLVAGQRVLEVGSGPGHLLVDLLESGREAYGLDLAPQMIATARRHLARSGLRGRLIRGDACCLPFVPESFDTVVATFPSGYALTAEFGDEAGRVLRPGGRLVVVLGARSNAWPWPGLLEWALGRARAGSEDEQYEPRWPMLRARHVDLRGPFGVAHALVAERSQSPRVG